jgi:hypothetical protein
MNLTAVLPGRKASTVPAIQPDSYDKIEPMLALAFVLSLARPADAASNCTPQQAALAEKPDPTDRPFTAIATNPNLSEGCRAELLSKLLGSIRGQASEGLCPGNHCAELDLALGQAELGLSGARWPLCSASACVAGRPEESCAPCRLDPAVADALAQADRTLAAVVEHEILMIREKIAAGSVPTCLLPAGCPDGDCRAALIRKWSDGSLIFTRKDGKEKWLGEASFLHLLLANAFTCDAGKQIGGTCAIYSGASLTSAYCAMPRFNPAAASSCTDRGPGFRCPSSAELLRDAHADGAWKITTCSEDETGQATQCAAAYDNPEQKAEKDAVDAYEKNCAFGPRDADCRARLRRIEDLRRKAGKETGAAWVSGFMGAPLGDLSGTLKRYGFSTVLYSWDEASWEALLASVDGGDPVQLALDANGWTGMSKDTGTVDGHAIVMEGHWKDARGTDWVLVNESNEPATIRLFEADEIKKNYLNYHGGGVGICTPQDPSRCTAQK